MVSTINIILFLMVFLVLKITIRLCFFIYIKKIKKLKLKIFTQNLKTPIEKIIATYIDENKMSYKIDYISNKKKTSYNKNTIFLNPELYNYFYLDKILGNLWLASTKKQNKEYYFYRFFSYYFVLITHIIFYLNLFSQILLLSIRNIFINNEIIILFDKYNIYIILSFLVFMLHISSIWLSHYCKKYYDLKYDNNLDSFILKYFPETISEFITVRLYHKNILFTSLPIWNVSLFKNNDFSLGPFVKVY